MITESTNKKEKSARLNDVSHSGGYTEAVGRRKTSIARVRLAPSSKTAILVNDRALEKYFPTMVLKQTILSVFEHTPEKFNVTARLSGGGISSQAEALRHGISRALVRIDSGLRTKLKVKGFLKRDPRAKERRKFGLKKARKAPQWSKR